MKKKILFLISILIFTITFTRINVFAGSYLSDKTEIPVELEVAGANAICQTDDGYVWIGQYSGLTRYDSKRFETFTSFEDSNGVTYDITNVKVLIEENNVLFILTTTALYIYENYEFSYVDIGLTNTSLNAIFIDNGILYISTVKGLILYDVVNKVVIETKLENLYVYEAVVANNKLYYHLMDGLYDENNNKVVESVSILDIYTHNNIIYLATVDGEIYQYDAVNNVRKDTIFSLADQINKLLYSDDDNVLYMAGEKGLYSIDIETENITQLTFSVSYSRLVDLFEDYEGNLWIASYDRGVSIIAKNDIVDLLFDVDTTIMPESSRGIYAIEKIGDVLYIASNTNLYLFDVINNQIIDDNPIMDKINEYLLENDTEDHKIRNNLSFRDIELYNDKIYVAAYNMGLVEYDLNTNDVVIYDNEYIDSNSTLVSENGTKDYYKNIRCIRAFDDFIVMGYSQGLIKFDGIEFYINELRSSVLYVDKDLDGNIEFVYNRNGIYTADDSLDNLESVFGNDDSMKVAGFLKFMYDDNTLYYNINSKLYAKDLTTNETKEIEVPNIKGSIVELSKVKVGNDYKYVIASENQIFIVDDLKQGFTNYQFYDSTDGLKSSIAANTSGYYDEENKVYYFQSKNGIFTYDFNISKEKRVRAPLKLDVNSIYVGDNIYHGNEITIPKSTSRLVFNVSAFGFSPNKGYKLYYRLEGAESKFMEATKDIFEISYTNLKGGKYVFHAYLMDEFGQQSNEILITINKPKYIYEQVWFWVIIVIIGLIILGLANYLFIHIRIKKAQEREKEYREITIESIEAIARTIDAKDSYTNGHSKRVGIYSREIAKALNLSQHDIDNIYYIALLHDIGKIAIPITVLNKPGKLTDEEFEIMKSHTTASAKILDGITTIPNIVDGAKYHHEKYGGGGYPTGIKGEEIPFIARIICCADCYDAMATKRVYKEPYPKEKIISEFERCKNIQFDPHIADIVIKLIKEDRLRYGTELKEDKKDE